MGNGDSFVAVLAVGLWLVAVAVAAAVRGCHLELVVIVGGLGVKVIKSIEMDFSIKR